MKNTNNSNRTFRSSTIERILSLISESRMVEEAMQDLEKAMGGKGLDMQKMFYNSSSPLGREAFKLGYQMIDSEYAILMEHEDKAIRENWFTHFVEYHDHILEKLVEGGNTIYTHATHEFGDAYINDVFRQDARSLEEIISIVAETYIKAEKLKKQHHKKLSEKLRMQLHDVIATLNELTIENGSKDKKFTITTEGAVFEITTHNEEEKGCDCGCGESGDISELLEKMIKSLVNSK